MATRRGDLGTAFGNRWKLTPMSAYGRKRPLKTVDFEHSERPLSGKADIGFTGLEKWTAGYNLNFVGTLLAHFAANNGNK